MPTCNLLVRKDAYQGVGGLDEALRFGEDVDLCWKLRKRGHRQFYVPPGAVRHKHRNRLTASAWQRFHYGTSEPVLYARHPEVKKSLPWQPWGLAFWVSLALQPVAAHLAWGSRGRLVGGIFAAKKLASFPGRPWVYARIIEGPPQELFCPGLLSDPSPGALLSTDSRGRGVLFPGARPLILAASCCR